MWSWTTLWSMDDISTFQAAYVFHPNIFMFWILPNPNCDLIHGQTWISMFAKSVSETPKLLPFEGIQQCILPVLLYHGDLHHFSEILWQPRKNCMEKGFPIISSIMAHEPTKKKNAFGVWFQQFPHWEQGFPCHQDEPLCFSSFFYAANLLCWFGRYFSALSGRNALCQRSAFPSHGFLGCLSQDLPWFHTSQVVQNIFHQRYEVFLGSTLPSEVRDDSCKGRLGELYFLQLHGPLWDENLDFMQFLVPRIGWFPNMLIKM